MKTVMLKDMPILADSLIQKMKSVRIFALIGSLGAGKTTLVTQIMKKLGVVGPVQSPTYTYVSAYTTTDGKKIYHFDLYRISSVDEFFQAGFDEYLAQEDAYCFIEWPEVIQSILPQDTCTIKLEYADESSRTVSISP